MCVDLCVCVCDVYDVIDHLYDITIIKHLYVYFPIAWWSDPFQRFFVRPDSPATPSEALQTLGSSWYGRHLDPLTRVWSEEIVVMLASCLGCIYSGGGFKYVFIFTPILGGDELILTSIFFNGGRSTAFLSPPTVWSLGFKNQTVWGWNWTPITEGPGMYDIDASEKGGLGRNIAFSEGMCTMATSIC